MFRKGKRSNKLKDAANNSMDVRAKQRLCLLACPLNSNGLSGGFAPRHLSRSVLASQRFSKQD